MVYFFIHTEWRPHRDRRFCDVTGTLRIRTEYSEPVVERDDDEATDQRQHAGVVRVARADVVAVAAMYEYDHCQVSGPVVVVRRRRGHVAVARVCNTTTPHTHTQTDIVTHTHTHTHTPV